MAAKRITTKRAPNPPRYYMGADVPMSVIRRFAREVAERFRPEKIILFGSYAYGTPHSDSDVDVLVIMPCRNELGQAARIGIAVEAPFALDIIVLTPTKLAWRLREGDWFLREVIARGKVLYAKPDHSVGEESGRRLSARHKTGAKP